MSWVAAAIVYSAYTGSQASGKAADTQAQAAADSAAAQERMFNKQVELQAPFRESGLTAQNRLMELLGLGAGKTRDQYRQELLPQFTRQNEQVAIPLGGQGNSATRIAGLVGQAINQGTNVDEAALNAEINRRMAAAGTSPDYGKYARDFGMADFQADPGYAFRLSEGQKALDRSAAARGGLISGAALKAATRYGQDMGSQEYTNAFNRYQTNRSNQLNPLQSLSGGAQTATNTLSNAAGTLGTQLGQDYMGAANARASGYVGQSNAINQGLGTYLNYNQNQNMMNMLNQNNIMSGLQTPEGIANYFKG